jgi:hypothetical protein
MKRPMDFIFHTMLLLMDIWQLKINYLLMSLILAYAIISYNWIWVLNMLKNSGIVISSTNGNISISNNGRSCPGYNFRLIDFVSIPGLHNKFFIKASYGAKHSWTRDLNADENNRIYIKDTRFYEDDVKRYLPVGMYREYLLQHYLTFLSHHIMNKYAKYRGSRIINKTKYSFIEK